MNKYINGAIKFLKTMHISLDEIIVFMFFVSEEIFAQYQ